LIHFYKRPIFQYFTYLPKYEGDSGVYL